MSEDKPVHVSRGEYPASMYPQPVQEIDRGDASEEGIHLLDYWHIILTRRWTIAAILFTIVAGTMIVTLRQVPIYQAEVTIQIDREDPNILAFKGVYDTDSTNDDTLQTQFKILVSRSLARRVVEDLKLDKAKEFQPGEPGFVGSYIQAFRDLFASKTPDAAGPEESDHIRPYVDKYLGRIKVNPVLNSRLVKVTFEAKDPAVAAEVINAHAKHFNQQNLQYKVDATQLASEFLKDQTSQLKANLEKAEDRLQEYSRDNEILFTEEGRSTATETLKRLEEEYTKAQSDRFQKESFFRLLAAGNIDSLPQVAGNSLLSAHVTRLADLRRQDALMAVVFRPEAQQRRELQNQIKETESAMEKEKERVTRTIRTEYEAATGREKLLSGAVAQQTNMVNKINQEIIQYSILKREADSYKQLYDGLLTRLREAGISAGLRASNIRLVDPAEVPTAPVRPQKSLNMVLSLVIGLVFGVGVAFLQEYLDNTVKSAQDVNRYLGLPLLATIPKLQSINTKNGYQYAYLTAKKAKSEGPAVPTELVTHGSPTSLMAEAYRSLRTSLLLSSPERPPRTVLVTSAVPSEGKTVTAINMAISLTQSGSKVILIDGDMRKPRIHGIFGLGGLPGISSFLTGASPLKEVIHESSVPNLYVMPCGPIPPNPAELILSASFRKMMSVLSEYFDYVILDSPPVSNVSDARVLGSACEGTVLVVKAGSTSRHMAKRAVQYLVESRIRISGVALNDLDVNAKVGYYSYNAGYHYAAYRSEDAPKNTDA